MKKIVIAAPHNAVGMSIMLIQDICWMAAQLAGDGEDGENRETPRINILSSDGKPVDCFTGTQISADASFDEQCSADAVFIAAFGGDADTAITDNPSLFPWLRKMDHQGSSLIALSNSAFFIAEAGLLNNKVATIYAPYVQTFRERYPDVILRPERAITDAGGLYCADGIPSGCDLCVAIIEQLYGPDIARQVASRFLMGFNRSYSQWQLAFDSLKYHKDHQILTAQQWLERHFAEDVHLNEVAADLGMSPRNLSRRFNSATGYPPQQYLQHLRVEAAKELLQTTALKIIEVSYRVGYSDLSSFNKVFKKVTGLTPKHFRQTAP
jgi:transcriptional regulator GlxA family with amidase domain